MIEIFGWVAAIIGIVANIPQLTRILRARTSAGVSLLAWQFALATAGAWCVHGYLVGQQQMQWPNLIMALSALVIVVFVVRDRQLSYGKALAFPLILWAALSATNVIFGALVYGIVVAVPQLTGQSSQLRDMIKSPELTGVSGGYLAILLLVQSMWFVFGIYTTDWALITCAGAMVVLCSANLGVYLVRTSRARRAVRIVAAS